MVAARCAAGSSRRRRKPCLPAGDASGRGSVLAASAVENAAGTVKAPVEGLRGAARKRAGTAET